MKFRAPALLLFLAAACAAFAAPTPFNTLVVVNANARDSRALGAYYAYQAFCEEAGFEPVPLDDFKEWNMGKFIGTYTYSVNSRNLKEDEVIALVPPGNENSGRALRNDGRTT